MQVLGVDVWNGTLSQVQNYASGGGRNVTYPLGIQGGSVGNTWGVDRSSYAIIDTFGVLQFITSNSTPYTTRYSQNEAAMIAKLQLLTPVEQIEDRTPATFSLGQSFPNPFRQETTIRFEIPPNLKAGHVRLVVFNLLGQEVRTLVSRHLSSGVYRSFWDGRDEAGNLAPGGIYFYKLEAGTFVAWQRLVFLP